MTLFGAPVLPIAAMALTVLAANIGVQHPLPFAGLGEALTYGAITYPFAFLVTDLTNRRHGPRATRRVVYAGFAAAVALSALFATPRIALASGAAFLFAQLLDVVVFDRLRRKAWWQAPLVSSVLSSALDTVLFFTLAFAGVAAMSGAVASPVGAVPLWVNLAMFDYVVKLAMAALFVAPYGFAVSRIAALRRDAATA